MNVLNFFSAFYAASIVLLRDGFCWLVFWVALAVFAASLGASEFSGRQPASVGLDVGLSVIRLLLPVAIVLMAQSLFFKEFERRYFLTSLTYPCSRGRFFFARFGALCLFCFALLLALACLLKAVVWYVAMDYEQEAPVDLGRGYWLVIVFIALDLLVIASLACLLAVFSSSSGFILVGTLGGALVARSFAVVIQLLSNNETLVSDAEAYRSSVGLLGYLFPDLSGLDIRGVAVYGDFRFLPVDWLWLVISVLSYSAMLLCLAIWILRRKKAS